MSSTAADELRRMQWRVTFHCIRTAQIMVHVKQSSTYKLLFMQYDGS